MGGKNVFGGILDQPVCLSMCCVSVQNTSFCQRAGGGIKSCLVTAPVMSVPYFTSTRLEL